MATKKAQTIDRKTTAGRRDAEKSTGLPSSFPDEFNNDATWGIFNIANSLSSSVDLDGLLKKIGTTAEHMLNCEASSVMLLSDDKRSLYFKSASGDTWQVLKKVSLSVDKGIAGWVARNNKPELILDVAKDPRFTGNVDKSSGFVTHSMLCVPLVFRGEVIGVLEVLNKKKGNFTQEHIRLLSGFANMASAAIMNTKLIQEQRNFSSNVLGLWESQIESSKPQMVGHPDRSSRLACAIGKVLEIDDHSHRMLYYAGLLHDFGYLGLNNTRLLNEMGLLTGKEEHHPLLSVKMLSGITMLEGALPMIKHHHEHFDGTGFPSRLKGKDIPLGARILNLVEGVEELRMIGLEGDALQVRTYEEIRAGSGTRYDPDICEAALSIIDNFLA